MNDKTHVSSAFNWDKVTAIATVVIACGGIVALVIAGTQIHESREEAKVQHLVEFLHDFDSPARSANRRALAKKRIDTTANRLHPLDPDDPPEEIIDELNFCEDLGLFTHRGYLDRRDIWNDFSYWLFVIYADGRPYLDAEQKIQASEFRECTNLVESLRPIEQAEDPTGGTDHPSEKDIYREYEAELDSSSGQSSRSSKHAIKP